MSLKTRLAYATSALAWSACAAGVPPGAPRSIPPPAAVAGAVAPDSAAEIAALETLDSWPPGARRELGGAEVTADAPYPSASGRICRVLLFRRGELEKVLLACYDGKLWFYVPDVFHAATPSTPSS